MKTPESILNNFPGMAVKYCPDTELILESYGADLCHILGMSRVPKTLTIKKIRELIVKADKDFVLNTVSSAIQKNKGWNIEYRIHRNKKTLWVREQGCLVKGKQKNSFDIFFQDVSEFKNQSKKLMRMLDKANEHSDMKNEFFASISHEIRTPMNAVMGMAQVLGNTVLDGEQKQYVSTIVDSAKSLVQVINDLMDFSKLEAGKLDILHEEFDLEKLCLDVSQLLMSHAYQKQLSLYLNFTPAAKRKVKGDPTRIRQVLVNLIGNAIKFTPSGFVSLNVDFLIDESGKECFRFAVEDTGIGISKEAQTQLFKAFAQANSQISKNFGGTGLGLRVCQQLVKLMHGEIGITSVEHEGSIFWFAIPLEVVEESQFDIAALQNKKVLVVDNDPVELDAICNLMESWGVEVKEVNESEDTLALLAMLESYDLFVINKELRGLDGLKLSSLIKQDGRYQNVPIVLLTSVAKDDDKSEIAAAGVTAYTSKPISPSLLYYTLRTAISADSESKEPLFIASDVVAGKGVEKSESISVKGKVLIVDDVDVNRLVLNSFLSHMGLMTDFAENGQVAVDKVKRENFDMIFMDCRMPVMDGYEATTAIRNLESVESTLPIIALTANYGAQDKQQCLDAGMSDFLSKPFAEQDLMQLIKQWMPAESVTVVSGGESVTSSKAHSEYIEDRQWSSMSQLLQDEFEKFVTDTVSKFDEYYDSIKQACSNGDFKSVVEQAHALKGVSGLLGAKLVSEVSAKIEAAGAEKEFETININLAKLGNMIEETSRAVTQAINPDLDQSIILF